MVIYSSTSLPKASSNSQAFQITHSDPALQRLLVFLEEGLLDVSQVDLGAAYDDPDEGLVRGAQALHGVVQSLGEETHFTLNAFH